MKLTRQEVEGGEGKQVMEVKKGTCCDEHRVFHVSDESLNSAPKTNVALYVG